MTNPVLLVLTIILIVSLIILVVLTRKSPASTEKLRESLFRNMGVPHRNLLGFVLGATASILLLSGTKVDIKWLAVAFVAALVVTMALLIFVRPYNEREVDRFAWGLLVIIVLGFGLGALTYRYRSWIAELWRRYQSINEPAELLLESLFLLGIILGFFVVRNWAKEQKDFLSSLSAVLGGAFIATILGKLQGEGISQIGALRAFAYYSLGFTLSGTINLLAAARLTANYINRRSVSSRAMLDFLYGSERTKLIDGYFLKNFKEDPDYAKRWLTDTLIHYRKLIRREFAEKMEERKKDRERERNGIVKEMWKRSPLPSSSPLSDLESLCAECSDFERQCVAQARMQLKCGKEFEKNAGNCEAVGSAAESTVDEMPMSFVDCLLSVLEEKRQKLEPCSKLEEAKEELNKLRAELKPAYSKLAEAEEELRNLGAEPKTSPESESRYTAIAHLVALLKSSKHKRLDELKEQIRELETKCDKASKKEWECLSRILGRLKPSYYYELIAIECEEKKDGVEKTTPSIPGEHGVIYRSIPSSDHAKGNPTKSTIHRRMFRVGIAMRWQDTLQYIVAPGQYGLPFPVMGSVAGLALLMGQTIVMDRDRNKKFRSKHYGRGVCPGDIEQPRGLDEITFLSYFSIPVVARMGSPDENPLGISNVDTKLFATRLPLPGKEVKGSQSVFRIRLTQKQLSEFASNLYEEEDRAVRYVEDHTKIITPVLELYSKCRVGAI